jgi:hypothetical protein
MRVCASDICVALLTLRDIARMCDRTCHPVLLLDPVQDVGSK